jgi:cyanate permease
MLKNRSVAGAALSGFFLNLVFGVAVNYLPLLYQARGASALDSGVDILAFMMSSVVILIAAAILVKKLGYYKPWMVAGPWIASIGAGCLTNGSLLTSGELIGWQILLGVGYGGAFQNTSRRIAC